MTDEPLSPLDEERKAIARIGFTEDGRLLHRYLRRLLESCRATEEGGALQRHEGGRILARDLMALMAEGIDGRDRTDQPLVPRTGGPVAVTRARGARRRVGPSTQPLVTDTAEPEQPGDAE